MKLNERKKELKLTEFLERNLQRAETIFRFRFKDAIASATISPLNSLICVKKFDSFYHFLPKTTTKAVKLDLVLGRVFSSDFLFGPDPTGFGSLFSI